MIKKYISIAQAANRLKVSVGTIYNYCKIGTLGYRCIPNRTKCTWQVDLESLELLEENSTFKSSLQVKKEMAEQFSLF